MTWTSAEIRSFPCPRCKAGVGEPCRHYGPKAESKTRKGAHHQKRVDLMVQARRRAERSDDVIEDWP